MICYVAALGHLRPLRQRTRPLFVHGTLLPIYNIAVHFFYYFFWFRCHLSFANNEKSISPCCNIMTFSPFSVFQLESVRFAGTANQHQPLQARCIGCRLSTWRKTFSIQSINIIIINMIMHAIASNLSTYSKHLGFPVTLL